jgi:hypothetical protein
MKPNETPYPGSVKPDGTRDSVVGMRNSVSDTVCVGKVGGTGTLFGLQHEWAAKSTTIPWIENITSAYPEPPVQWFLVNARINAAQPNAMSITFPAANRLHTTYTQIPPAPAPSTTVENAPSTMVAGYFMNTPIPLDSSFAITQPTKSLPPTFTNDQVEMEVNLTPESGSVPTADTEG